MEDDADDDDDEGIDDDDGIELMFNGSDNIDTTQDINDPAATSTLPNQDDSDDSGELDDPVGGRSSKLVEDCFRAAPALDLQQYREPGAVTAKGAGPLPLQIFISPPAPTLLAVHPDDPVVLSDRCRNYSFEERATFLHRTWDALHQYT